MCKLLTPARCDALFATAEGKRVLDAAVAVAMGWDGPGRLRQWYHRRWEPRATPPPYASCAPDAPDRWRWRGEMIEALAATPHAAMTESQAMGAAFSILGVMLLDADAPAVPIACIKGLVAAGKLKEPENANGA